MSTTEKQIVKPELKLKKFDISEIKGDSTIVIIAKRAPAKNFLVLDLLKNQSEK